jgi:hypothetical protein
MKVNDVIRDMLTLLGENGEHWTKGTLYRDAEGEPCIQPEAVKYCLKGALNKACSPLPFYDEFYEKVHKVIMDSFPYPQCYHLETTRFNDDPGTTFNNIRWVLHKALNKAEELS